MSMSADYEFYVTEDGFVALLWSKNGGFPKCFAGLRLIKDDLESHKRRY
jgi:hypothetical protein